MTYYIIEKNDIIIYSKVVSRSEKLGIIKEIYKERRKDIPFKEYVIVKEVLI